MRSPSLTSSFALLSCVSLALTLASPPGRAHGLATEQFGNQPIAGGNFGVEVLAAVNLSSRVYWYEVNGNPYFYFRGNATALNEALRKFAAIPAEKREIILLAGPGKRKSLGGDQRIDYDWALHVPDGIRFDKDAEVADSRATFTIHVTVAKPAREPDAKQVRGWIADLDSDDFATRDRAAGELARLGHAAAPLLRETLAGKPSAETRRRVEDLLGRLDGIGLDLLNLPEGIPVVDVEELQGRARRSLKSTESEVRGYAVMCLGHGAPTSEAILPDLLDLLKNERNEYVLRCAASILVSLGSGSRPALPAMKEHLNDPDENVRNAFKQAIETVEAAGEDKKEEKPARERKLLGEQIHTFCREHERSRRK